MLKEKWKYKNHHLANISVITDSGKNCQWMVKLEEKYNKSFACIVSKYFSTS